MLRVIGSGFIVRGRVGLFYALNRLLKNEHKRIKTAVLGCNIGPFYNEFSEAVTNIELRRFDLITVRDNKSYAHVRNKVKTVTSACYPDIMFSLPDDALKKTTGEDCLGISAYRSGYHSNLDFYKKAAELSDWYISQTNRKVLVFAFDTESENDLSAAHTILKLSRYPDRMEIIPHNDNGDNIIRGFSRCKTIVAVRYHSVVLALRMGLSVIPVCYSEKTSNLLDDIGYDYERFDLYGVDVDKIKNIILRDDDAFVIDPDIIRRANGHIDTFKSRILNS